MSAADEPMTTPAPAASDRAMNGDQGMTVRLPPEVAQAIAARIAGSGFASVESFVAYVLARLLENPSTEPFSEEDEQKLKERLRSLGYID